jgi:hypothetical protein
MDRMTSPHLHLPHSVPASPSTWFLVSIPATAVSLAVALAVWAVSGVAWLGFAAWIAVEASTAVVADRRGHRNVAALLGGALLTMVALTVVPVLMAHYYIAT